MGQTLNGWRQRGCQGLDSANFCPSHPSGMTKGSGRSVRMMAGQPQAAQKLEWDCRVHASPRPEWVHGDVT